MNTTKKHFKKNHVLFFPCILLKLASIKKKRCHLLPSKTFCWDTSPPKNTQKFLPPTLPRPTLLPGSLPLPPYGLSNRVPRTQFPRPNELPGKDLPRMNFPTKNAAKPPKKHNKKSKIHGFVRQNFSDFFSETSTMFRKKFCMTGSCFNVFAIHTSLVEAIFPSSFDRNCFVEARERMVSTNIDDRVGSNPTF